MKKFMRNDIAVELTKGLSDKEKAGLINAIGCFRDNFDSCDFYPSYRLAGGKNRISIGVKVKGKKPDATMFRIRPAKGKDSNRVEISLVTSSRVKYLKQLVNDENLDLNLDKPDDLSEFEAMYSFFLDDLSQSKVRLDDALKTIKKITKLNACMNGHGLSPDDYFEGSCIADDNTDDDKSEDDYQNKCDDVEPSDIKYGPKDKESSITKGGRTCYPRDAKIGSRAKYNAEYSCELNSKHDTFIQSKMNKNFVEAHHLIPLQHSGKFEYSLDNIANVVALCPNCHKLLHYGAKYIVKPKLKLLYDNRKSRLKKAGLKVTLKELEDFYP